MTTTRKIRPINLRDFQSRHLQTHKRLLVVEPLREQPPEYVGSFHAGVFHTTVVRRGGTEEPGPAVFGAYSDDGEWSAVSPHQPGDVVPVKERWAYRSDGSFAYFASAQYAKCDWREATRMPSKAIRLRPTVETVECMRVSHIGMTECVESGFPKSVRRPSAGPIDAFVADWSRRHKRQADAFERAFGWFYSLRLEK